MRFLAFLSLLWFRLRATSIVKYGAVEGDIRAAARNSAALAKATRKHRRVFVPAGVWWLEGANEIGQGCEIRGAGMHIAGVTHVHTIIAVKEEEQ